MEINYGKNNIEEVPLAQYMEEYKKLDPVAASKRCGIPYDEANQEFTVRMLQKEYAVSWPEFQVRVLSDDQKTFAAVRDEADAKIFVMRFLLHGVQVKSRGKFLTFREVPGAELYFQPFNGRCLKRLAFGYGFKPDQFAEAFDKMGAKQCSFGDVSYEIEFINGFFVQFILWTGDEEFPPSAQILFSDNFCASFEPYDLAVVGDISINTMKAMGRTK